MVFTAPIRIPQIETLGGGGGLSSVLAVLRTMQPRALGFLDTVDPLDSLSTCNCSFLCYLFLHHHWDITTAVATTLVQQGEY